MPPDPPESPNPELERQSEQFLEAIREPDTATAGSLLRRHPGIARADIFAASSAGEAEFLAEALAADPGLATARHEPDGWTPLLYLSASPSHADGPAEAQGLLRCAELLLAAGADPNSATFVDGDPGSPLSADGHRAREILSAHPGLLAELTAEDRQAFALAAEEGREASVRLMAELGFDLLWEGAWGGTPLHHAAWHGRPEMVGLLLALGAPVNVRDSQFGSSPLGWAAHGSANCRHADDDYCTVVELLLDAGADRETSINRWQDPPESTASGRVAELLAARGFASR